MTAEAQDSFEERNDPQVPDWSPGRPEGSDFSAQNVQQEPSKFRNSVDAVNSAMETTGSVITKIYGFILLAVAIIAIAIFPQVWFLGLLVAAYGTYLMWPGGWKLVIY